MTDAEWLACYDPSSMLVVLREKASDRKLGCLRWRAEEGSDGAMPMIVCAKARMLVAAVGIFAAALPAEPAKDAQGERKGPLASLPSEPGPHIEKIKTLADNTWLNLGAPAADPKWGKARGRAWTAHMPLAAELRSAFLYGEGVHGYVKPDGYYMDDLWFYDLHAHRWISIYPGTNVKEPGLKPDANGFPIDKDAQLTPVSLCVHGYDLLTYDSDLRKLMIMGVAEYHFVPKSLKALLAPSKIPPSSPWLYDVKTGKWEVHKLDGPVPEKGEGTLLYIPSMKTAFYRSGKSECAWFYDASKRTWARVAPKGPQPPFGIDASACYDPKRERIYIGGGNYPVAPAGTNAFWCFDLKTNTWLDLKPKGKPCQGHNDYGPSLAAMNYDSLNDAVVLCYHPTGDKSKAKATGIYVYDPAANAWSEKLRSMPEDWNRTPYGKAANSFYSPELNAHFFHVAGDSEDNGVMWAYRYKKK